MKHSDRRDHGIGTSGRGGSVAGSGNAHASRDEDRGAASAADAAASQARPASSPPLDDATIGLEARVGSDDHLSLKLWLRLLACSTQIETEIRRRLRKAFGITLARFDYLAQLHRHPDGLRMNVLSRYLMVTGGSITGLTDELQKEGLVLREDAQGDRRAFMLKLTPKGREAFERVAEQHEAWTIELLSGIDAPDRRTLYELLGHLRFQTAASTSEALRRDLPEAAIPALGPARASKNNKAVGEPGAKPVRTAARHGAIEGSKRKTPIIAPDPGERA